MSQRVVYFNGNFVPETAARVSIYDAGLTTGDMAFEVSRTYNHEPFRLSEHIGRLFHSLASLRVDPGVTADELDRLTRSTLERNLATESRDVDWNVIHNVSSGPAEMFRDAFAADELHPTLVISCFPLVQKLGVLAPAYFSGVDLVVPTQRSLPPDLLDPSIKIRSRLHYHFANFQARDICAGAWPVLVDPAGFLTESTSANVFLVRRDQVCTPREGNVLAGVTRGVIIELAAELGIPTVETDLTPEDALEASEVFLTSTSIGIVHARSFEGRPIGDGRLGPVALQLREAFSRAVGLDFVEQACGYARKLGVDVP